MADDANALKKRIQEVGLNELASYPASWIDDVLTGICKKEKLPLTIENKMKFAAMLDSDLYHEFHSGE